MVEKNNRSDGDVHLENPPKPKRPLKNPPKPPKTHPKPPKLREKNPKPPKTLKNSQKPQNYTNIAKLDYVQLCETQILNFEGIWLKNMN